jgi:hypothetical protein
VTKKQLIHPLRSAQFLSAATLSLIAKKGSEAGMDGCTSACIFLENGVISVPGAQLQSP